MRWSNLSLPARLGPTVALAALGLTLGGCGAGAPESDPDFTGSEGTSVSGALIGGDIVWDNRWAVTLYSYGYSERFNITGWTGLCSGTYLGTVDGWAISTTANHCREGRSDFRVTTDILPGRPWDTPPPKSPPPHLSQPWWVVGDWWAHPNEGIDQALIVLPDDATFRSGLTPVAANERPGLTFMQRIDIGGSTFTMTSSGAQTSTEDDYLTTGVLKGASGFGLPAYTLSPDASTLWYERPAGVSSAPGDSGAGFIKFFSYRDSSGGLHTWPILGGSLVNVALGVSPRYIADMVQAWIGAFYVSPMSNPNLFMVIDEAPRTTSTPGANNTKISYSSTTKQLSSLSGLCLNAWATAVPCNATDSTQRWRHTGDLQLKSEYSGYCLDPNGYYGHLQVVACNAVAEQAWVFRVGL